MALLKIEVLMLTRPIKLASLLVLVNVSLPFLAGICLPGKAIGQTAVPTTIPVNGQTITVDYAAQTHPLSSFWAYFGYDEPNYTYMRDGKKLLGELSALSEFPVYVRCHNLLTTGDGTPALKWGSTNAYTEDSQGHPVYDWRLADSIFDTYVSRGMKPLAEIGFMPESLSTHPEPYRHHWRPGVRYDSIYTGWAWPPDDYDKWGRLIEQWVRHCISRYGEKEVLSWLWEVWNEPNIGYWKGTEEEYFTLYDVTAAAVKRALPAAHIGGPATTGPGWDNAARWLRDFLDHCAAKKVPLDFISFHAKGSPKVVDGHVRMNMVPQLNDVSTGFSIVKASAYKDLPIYITECDPEGCAACGMSTNPENAYRNGTMYSSYTAASFSRIAALADSFRVNLAGAISWSFEFEDQKWFDGFRDLATNGVDKPVLDVFRMYGLMRGNSIPTANAYASADKRAMYVMVWNYTDDDLAGPPAAVNILLTHLPAKKFRLTEYRIDESHSNAYEAWKKMGSPQAPTPEQYRLLEAAGKLQVLGPAKTLGAAGGALTIPVVLPRQAVSLLRLDF
jgi:xylan 1,4-beta-xylosidase